MNSRTNVWRFVLLTMCVLSRISPAEAAPPYFQNLIDSGEVKFEFYDPLKKRLPLPGRTDFVVSVERNYRFQYRVVNRGNKRILIVLPQVKATGNVKHVMTLPNRYNDESRWKTPLVQHEFDHVASSQDPRLFMLARHISEKVDRIEHTLKSDETADLALAKRLVDEELTRRATAMADLVRFNYRLLDKVSRHGQQPIPDRELFFQSLYTKPNLDQARFAYTGDALDLLRSKAYREAELPYAP